MRAYHSTISIFSSDLPHTSTLAQYSYYGIGQRNVKIYVNHAESGYYARLRWHYHVVSSIDLVLFLSQGSTIVQLKLTRTL